MAKIDPANKSAAMAAIGVNYHLIATAEKELHALKVQAAPAIKEVIFSFGPGPHKMSVPTGEMNPVTGLPVVKDMIVNFRKDGDTFHASALPADQIT